VYDAPVGVRGVGLRAQRVSARRACGPNLVPGWELSETVKDDHGVLRVLPSRQLRPLGYEENERRPPGDL